MAAFDFPASPSDGQIYALNEKTYRYNAAKQRWDGFTVSGAQGIQGISGEQGIQGFFGEQGTQGTAGEVAAQGIAGSQGIQGIQGTGGDGNQGIQGAQGTAGEVAAQGAQGIAGSQGAQGIQGTGGDGNQGIQGIQGIQGTGSLGSQGIQGIQGTVGLPGENTVPSAGTKTTAYTLASSDVGDFVTVGTGGSIVIPSGVFSAGDVMTIYNDTTGNIVIVSSAVTSYISGSNTNVSSISLSTRGLCTILFVATGVCVATGAIQ